MSGWDVLQSFSSLAREVTDYAQEGPTHLQCHQWGLEAEAVVVSASKQGAISSILHAARGAATRSSASKSQLSECCVSGEWLCGSFYLLPCSFFTKQE